MNARKNLPKLECWQTVAILVALQTDGGKWMVIVVCDDAAVCFRSEFRYLYFSKLVQVIDGSANWWW